MRTLQSFAFLCLFFTLSFTAYSQDFEDGIVRVKIKENYINRINKTSLRQGRFGFDDVDRVNLSLGASKIKRVFREAGKYETAHKKFGLHLWYEIIFDKKTPLAVALGSYKRLSQFDIGRRCTNIYY